MAENPIPVLGILGGVASGKSTVARLLAARGAEVVDADVIGHQVLNLPHVRRRLCDEFGPAICAPDGSISRQALAGEAFMDARKLDTLNGIVHPIIMARVRQMIADIRRKGKAPLVALDAALLMETGLHEELCDALVFVDAPVEVRAQRARRARGWSREHFDRRERAQIAACVKREGADFVVDNSCETHQLERNVQTLWEDVVGRFRLRSPVSEGSHGPRGTSG